MKQPGVVAKVRPFKNFAQPRIDFSARGQRLQLAQRFNTPVLRDAQKDDAVENALHREVQVALGQRIVAQREVAREHIAPVLHVAQERVVKLRRAAPALVRSGIFVERALEHRLAREDGRDLVPALRVFLVSAVEDACNRGLVALLGFDAGVVNRELVEIGHDAEREFRRPRIAAELRGGRRIGLDAHAGLLGLDEKFARAADAKRVVGRLGVAADFQRILMHHVLVGLGVPRLVGDVPTQCLEQGIKKLAAQLGLRVARCHVGLMITAKRFNAFENARGDRHGVAISRTRPAGRRKSFHDRWLWYGRDCRWAGRFLCRLNELNAHRDLPSRSLRHDKPARPPFVPKQGTRYGRIVSGVLRPSLWRTLSLRSVSYSLISAHR
ncbi:MAG: hypothetical protein H3C27_17770 [Opitutaceae bacterium]|nr:hypothetical protein [Opitutaceae bacterium]